MVVRLRAREGLFIFFCSVFEGLASLRCASCEEAANVGWICEERRLGIIGLGQGSAKQKKVWSRQNLAFADPRS